MGKRKLVQISAEQVKKLKSIDSLRPDLEGYPISKKVAFLLHEKLAETYLKKGPLFPKTSVKGKWIEYIREPIPLHVLAPGLVGCIAYSKEMIGEPFTRVLLSNSSDKTWWCNYAPDIENVGNFLIKNLQEKDFASEYYEHYHALCIETKAKCESVRKMDLHKLNQQKLLKNYIKLIETTMRFYALTLDIDAMDIMAEKAIKTSIKQALEGISDKELARKYNTLVTPVGISYVTKEQLELYGIALKIQENKKTHELFFYENKILLEKLKEQNPKIIDSIQALVEKYWWTSLGWSTIKIKNVDSMLLDLKNILEENPNVEPEIKRINAFAINSKKEKEKTLKELKNSKINALVDIFEEYFYLHDLRKEMQMRATYSLNLILFELSRRFGYKFTDLSWAWPAEIETLIRTGKFNQEKALARKESFLTIVTEDGTEEFIGEEATLRRKQELAADIEGIHDFGGVPASIGKVRGKVKICFGAADAIAKIEKGDILVASMTTPDFLPAMKKASAIITDEGGITAHAAIVARELKIPCIVGTKIATKVLSDLDLVEVNANHAVVTIIEKAGK